MAEPTFDHERLDVYRLSIAYVAFSYRIAKSLSGVHRPARDPWLRAAQSIPLNIAEGNGKQSLKDKIGSSRLLAGRPWSVRRFMMSCGFETPSTRNQSFAENRT